MKICHFFLVTDEKLSGKRYKRAPTKQRVIDARQQKIRTAVRRVNI